MSPDRKTGLILFAEGSSREEAKQAVWKAAVLVGASSDFKFLRPVFSQTTQSNLMTTVEEAVRGAIERIMIVLFFLAPSLRVQQDLPWLVGAERNRHPQLDIRVTASREGHPLRAEIIPERVRQALREIKSSPA